MKPSYVLEALDGDPWQTKQRPPCRWEDLQPFVEAAASQQAHSYSDVAGDLLYAARVWWPDRFDEAGYDITWGYVELADDAEEAP